MAALLANLGIAVAKLLAFAFTGAASMLAEAVHSMADTTNQGLLFLGGALARRRATDQHPFGYSRERYFWAFIVAVVIFTVGAIFAMYEGIEKLLEPHRLESVHWALGVLGLAIVLESWSFHTALTEAKRDMNRQFGGKSWMGYIRNSKNPELPVVLLEDAGALLGLLIALAGILLALLTGDPRFDAMGSLAIGVLLAGIAVVLAIEMRSLLLGESASPHVKDIIRGAVEGHPDTRRLIHMRTEHLGPEDILLAAKVEFSQDLDLLRLSEAIDSVERQIRERLPWARLIIYIEPDLFRNSHQAPPEP